MALQDYARTKGCLCLQGLVAYKTEQVIVFKMLEKLRGLVLRVAGSYAHYTNGVFRDALESTSFAPELRILV